MRILAISDIHGRLPDLDVSRADCLLIAGDVCPLEYHWVDFQKYWLEHDFHDWCQALGLPVYLALGNHDFCDQFKAPSNLHYGLERIAGYILLFSWTLDFAGWAWEIGEGVLFDKLERLLGQAGRIKPPIWVTHGPPYGVCDKVRGESTGSRSLRALVERHQPDLLICGHIHEEGGHEGRIGRTRVFNVSVFDRPRMPVTIEYQPVGE